MASSSTPNPFDNPDMYDVIVLGGHVSPGTVRLSSHDRDIEWDIKNAAGQAGATMTRKGNKPVEFTATFYLVKDIGLGIDNFSEWVAFQRVIDSTVAGTTPKALDIYHPDLTANAIKSVVKKSVGGMTHDGKGGATVVVKFIEYFPPKKYTGTPLGSKTKSAKADPNAAAKAELEKLVNQYKAIP